MNNKKLKKIYIIVIALYVVIVTSFYFIVGNRLQYKESSKNIEMPDADSITKEITNDVIVEQSFNNTVDKIESIAIVFTKNYVEGSGTITIDLLDGDFLLARNILNVVDIPEQHRVFLDLKNHISCEAGKQLTLKVYANSADTNGVHIMMCKDADTNVNINGVYQQGILCFSVTGSDEISSSAYYWFIVAGIGIAIIMYLFVSYKNYLSGKNDLLAVGISAVNKYNFLISQLVERDFKSKYKRSVFGIFWSFLNPLLTMTVQYLVFSTFFNADTQNYPVYLISGVVCFSFFNECTTMCLSSISSNYRLITKVYMPKYIFPLSKTISSSVNLGISLIPLLLVTVLTGTVLHWSFLLMFYFLICLIIFSLGVGMILATLMVFFRDIQFLWSVICTIWQYATPIFYPAEIIPERFRFIVKFNPLYHFIGNMRKCLINGVSPEPISYVYCLAFALASLAIGSYIFKKCQDKFTLYL